MEIVYRSSFPFRKIFLFLVISFSVLYSAELKAQRDSIVLKNKDIIVGELKSMDKGVAVVETDYSKNDFTIEWSGVKEIFTKGKFLLTLQNGNRYNGSLHSSGDTLTIHVSEDSSFQTAISQIVFLKGVKSNFWSRASATISLGLSLTKANNVRQYSVRSTFGYVADRWQANFFYDDIRSRQDSVASTRRTEFGPSFRYFLQNDWFLYGSVNFLSNTEQALNLRTTAKVGAGNYVIHNSRAYLALGSGFSLNSESFTNETPSRTSAELYGMVELNLFDVKDFSLLTNAYVYPSLTESGRWRVDYSLDLKYDLPLGFFVKAGGTLNYDNRPAVPGKDIDYVTQFTVGWEL